MPWVQVAHSPTPSTVMMAASSKGLHKNADAPWLTWCSQNRTGLRFQPSFLPTTRRTDSFSRIHSGIACTNCPLLLGKCCRWLSRMRSSFSIGLS